MSDKQSLWSSASWREGWAEGYGDHTGDSFKKQGWMLVLRLLITEGEARKQPWREPMQCFQSNGQSPGRRATCLGRRWCCLERGMSWKRRCKGLFKTVRDSLGCGEETSHTWGKKWSARLWTAAWRKENFRIGRRWWGTWGDNYFGFAWKQREIIVLGGVNAKFNPSNSPLNRK